MSVDRSRRGVADAAAEAGRRRGAFAVRLDNFEGPFDLLLSLISKHKLDVTEVALSKVTDEFIAHIKAGRARCWDLEQTTSFLLVASTLLDLKAARLLPQGDVEDEEDLALLEARDLLFARLLQYRAFKQVAGILDAPDGRRGPAAPALGRPGGAVRHPAARGADRARARGVRRAGRPGAGAQAGARGHRPGPHPRARGERARAGRGGGGPAAGQRHA